MRSRKIYRRATRFGRFRRSSAVSADVFSAVRDAFDSGVSAARVIEAESRAALAEYDEIGEDGSGGERGRGRERAGGVDARAGVRDDEAFGEVEHDACEARTRASVDLDAKVDAAHMRLPVEERIQATVVVDAR